MKTLILSLVLVLSLSCSKSNDANTFTPQTITPILISKGEVFNGNYNPTYHSRVFYTQTDWTDFINNTWGTTNAPATAVVDFNLFEVIASFDQPRTTGGFDINITSAVENQDNIVIQVSRTGSGDATQMPTRPYHFVKIPKSTKTVIFQ
ncbi:protease complex subunit PrcB family protein [Flavobacterium sp.]|uniref:protease complex subunit PrcB family protein n=1 Tax=Flavobacterium sp. TaxID=239 RepID=UPI0025E1998A|nr:protease complex subunit PrcB family protein [Flavobacterium sp.]